ncbi:hypothetical protein ABZT48_08075 [Streptomyces avermitilis]|uniref:NACHT domain-containing protein n=1 Tax=Streptomyces avermitilis TaxID=33903 RepID=UPI0033A5A02D
MSSFDITGPEDPAGAPDGAADERETTVNLPGAMDAAVTYQPRWAVDSVYMAKEISFVDRRVVVNETPAPAPDPSGSPAPADGPAFRKALARVLLSKLTSTLDETHWLDHKLVELTAIVEDVDGYPAAGHRSLWRRRGRYATRPLTQVLARPETDLILLQGAPGAGKSVAMWQHAVEGLRQIVSGRNPDLPLPIYVNLRELRAKPDEINTDVLRKYIAQQTGPRGSIEIASYFAHCFTEDLRTRRVTLLLDSFDEIPAVLGSATVDKAVSPYVQTVIELVGGGGRCVVASREYKGPRAAGWTRLHILGLSSEQQESFLRGLGLGRGDIGLVQPLLTDPRHGFVTELQNPLSLKLLASYVEARHTLPERPSAVFEEYVSQRLHAAVETTADTGELRRVEDFLARFAFRLTSTDGGLSVSEREYGEEIAREAGDDAAVRELLLRVVPASRLLVSAPEGRHAGRRVFFGHRRVQQYFASRHVTSHPSAVAPFELVTNGRWRETAVTVLQDGSPEITGPLMAELAGVLTAEWGRYRAMEEASRREYVPIAEEFTWSSYGELVGEEGANPPPLLTPFAWSPMAVHCLELLSAAYHGQSQWPRAEIEGLVQALVDAAWRRGSVSDRKFAVDCLPLLPEPVRERYIDRAFAGGSGWIRTTALRDCATLPALTPGIRRSIRRLLITMLSERSLATESHAVDVDLRRLHGDDDLVRVRRIISWSPKAVAVICVLHALVAMAAPGAYWWRLRDQLLWWYAVPLFFFWWFQSTQPLSYGVGKSRTRLFFERVVNRTVGVEMDVLETDVLLGSLVMIAGLQAALQVALGCYEITEGHTAWGLLEITLYAPLSVCALLWGPSLLYAVRQGRSSRELSAIRLVLVVPDTMRLQDHPARALSRQAWARFAWDSLWGLLKMAVFTSPVWGTFALLYYAGGHIGHILALVLLGLLTGYFPLVVVIGLVREFRAHRRVQRAVLRGSRGGAAFVEAMFSLRDTGEAAEYVRRIRGIPGMDAEKLDRQAVRASIAHLQNRPGAKPSDAASAGFAGTAPRRPAAWRADDALLDELGRLDEHLRAR